MRNAMWVIRKYPEIDASVSGNARGKKLLSDDELLKMWFDASITSKRLFMFQFWFYRFVCGRFHREEALKTYNRNLMDEKLLDDDPDLPHKLQSGLYAKYAKSRISLGSTRSWADSVLRSAFSRRTCEPASDFPQRLGTTAATEPTRAFVPQSQNSHRSSGRFLHGPIIKFLFVRIHHFKEG